MIPRRIRRPPLPPAAWAALAVTVLALAGTLVWLLRGDDAPAPTEAPAASAQAEAAPGEGPAEWREGAVSGLQREVVATLRRTAPPAEPLSRPLRVTLGGVVWNDPSGGPFLRARTAVALVDPELAGDSLVVQSLDVGSAVVTLVRDRRGAWNYERALGLDEPAAEDGTRVIVHRARIRGGRALVRQPGTDYVLRDVDAALPLLAFGGGAELRVVVARGDAVLEVPAEDLERRLAVRDLRLRFPGERVAFELDRLEVGRTVVVGAAGTFRPGAPALGLEADARVERLLLEDVAFLSPRLPREGTASFAVRVEAQAGGRLLLRVQGLALATGESSVAGSLVALVGGTQPAEVRTVDLRLDPLQLSLVQEILGRELPYGGTLRGSVQGTGAELRFDLAAVLTGEEFEQPLPVDLTGFASLAGGEFRLGRLVATLEDAPLAAVRGLAPGLPLAGTISGTVTIEGPPGQVPLRLDVRVDVAGGFALVEGTLDLTGAVAAYDLQGRLVGIELAALFEPDVPPVSLTAGFTAVGRGFDPATAEARFAVEGDFHGWRAEPRDTLALRGTVSGGRLALDTLAIELATLTAAASGTWALRGAGGDNAIRYVVQVDSLAPFGPYLPMLPDGTMRGALEAEGRLAGSLDAPRLEGTASAEDFRFRGWTVESAAAEYRGLMVGEVPELRLGLATGRIETPGAGAFERSTLELILSRPRFELELAADRATGGVIEVTAEGQIPVGGPAEVRLSRLHADLENRRWRLERPATIRWGGVAGLLVRDFRVGEVDGDGLVAIDGLVPPTARADLQIELADVPIGDVLRMIGRERLASGDLWLDARIEGPPDAPEFEMDFRLAGGQLRGVPVTLLEGQATYDAGMVVTEATANIADTASLRIDARLPFAISFAEFTFRPLRDRPIQANIETAQFPLAALNGLSPFLRDLEGQLRSRVRIAGTMDEPVLNGTAAVANGAVTFVPAAQRYTRIDGEAVLEGRRAVVRELRAWSDGWATVTGTVFFEELLDPRVDLVAVLEGFRALGADDRPGARAAGEVRLTGNVLSAPVLTGRVEVEDGDIPIPSRVEDPLLEVELGGIDAPALPTEGQALGEEAPPEWWDVLRIDDLVARIGSNVWFIVEQSRAQLAGELTISKRGEVMRIVGTLEGERGTFTLTAGPLVRRFDIVDAQVRFRGEPEPDPAIDITASRVVFTAQGRQTEIRVRVQGTVTAPRVSLSTPGGAQVGESELLSILFFGRADYLPGEELAGGAGALQQALVLGGFADLLSIEVEEEIAQLGVPFDIFQIRPGGLSQEGGLLTTVVPNILVGKELADDVFLTLEAGLRTLFGGTGGEEGIAWTATLRWLIDREWTLELAWRPVRRDELFRLGAPPAALAERRAQFTLDLLRRWTY